MQTHFSWRPYVAGALVGVLATLSVLVSTQLLGKTQYLGASTTFVRAAGFLEQEVDPARVKANPYFAKNAAKIDWQFMVVVGIFIGALGASVVDGSFKLEAVPPVWRERFGGGVGKRAIGAFLGGVVAMFGARMADGCPSGHGLSGLMQLSVSGFIALALFFGVGVLVAALVYRQKGGLR
ncbi:MAG: YeeE/YedE family protein [Desulfobacteraceae bacterium]|nr:MAG: YeeE/YedE family protein [Desulfobacteraceae bacterium]